MISLGIIFSIVVSSFGVHSSCFSFKGEEARHCLNCSSMQCNRDSLFELLEYSGDTFLSGNVMQGGFECPTNVTSIVVNEKSDDLVTSIFMDELGECEVTFQTPGLDGEYYASFTFLTDNEEVSYEADAFIYSENGIDVFSTSSINDAKGKYYLQNVASFDDLVALGIEEVPNHYFSSDVTEYDAYDRFSRAVYGDSDIAMTYNSSSQNLSGNVRVNGNVYWCDQNNSQHPLTGVQIGLYEDLWLLPHLYEETCTDSNGYFSLEMNPRCFFSTIGRGLFLKLFSVNSAVRVANPLFDLFNILATPYIYSTQKFDSPCLNKEYTCNIVIHPELSDRAAAFEICEAEQLPFNYVSALNNGFQMPEIVAFFPNVVSNLFTVTSYYFRDLNYISFSKKHYDNWDILNHEYGHYICDYFNLCAPSFFANHSGGVDLTVDFGVQNGLKLAMSEGLATYIGIASQIMCGSNLNVPFVGDEADFTYYDYGEYCYGENLQSTEDAFGEANECSITSLLIKIMDDVNRQYDDVSIGHQGMWNALASNTHWCISSLIQTIVSLYPEVANSVSVLLEKELFVPALNNSFPRFLSTNQNDSCWTFEWDVNGSTSPFPNRYSLRIDNNLSNALTISNIATTSLSLASLQINTLLSLPGSTFDWSVQCYHDYPDGTTTGPYSSTSSIILKPIAPILSLGQNNNLYLFSGENNWQKFTAGVSGTYYFESSGNIDLVGDIYESMVTDDTITGYLAYDDDGGDVYNYKVSIYLEPGETVYLRTKAYNNTSYGSYSINVSYNHFHSYFYSFSQYSSTKHKAYCSCGEYKLQSHVSDGNSYQIGGHYYTNCIHCGQSIDMNFGPGIPLP